MISISDNTLSLIHHNYIQYVECGRVEARNQL